MKGNAMRVRTYVQKVRQTRRMASGAMVALLAALAASPAAASSSGGGGLPWETPLQTITTSITGPVAFAISVIGVVELMLTTRQIIARNFMSLEFYCLAGIIYFLISFSIERLGRRVERRIALPLQ